MSDQDLTMKAINLIADHLGMVLVVNPPTGAAQDWAFDSEAKLKDQKGDCVVSLKPKP